MNEKEIMQEGMDLRWNLLLLAKRSWLLLAAAVLGALVFGGGYFARHVVWGPAKEYAALSRYYIEFTDDKGKDYYNAYTWNDFIASDPILNAAMPLLPEGMQRETVVDAVRANIEADVRVLTTTVTTNDPELSMTIAEAVEQAVVQFGRDMKEIKSIRIIKPASVEQVVVDLYTVRAAVLGALGCLLLAAAYLAMERVLDTSVYLPADFEKRYRYPVFGLVYQDGADRECSELFANLDYICGEWTELLVMSAGLGREKEVQAVCGLLNTFLPEDKRLLPAASCLENAQSYENLRCAQGIILAVPYGGNDGPVVAKTVEQLKKQNCNIVGAVIYGAERKMLECYYFPGRK